MFLFSVYYGSQKVGTLLPTYLPPLKPPRKGIIEIWSLFCFTDIFPVYFYFIRLRELGNNSILSKGLVLSTIDVMHLNGNVMNIFTFNFDTLEIKFDTTKKQTSYTCTSLPCMENAFKMAKLYRTMVHNGYHKYESFALLGLGRNMEALLNMNYRVALSTLKKALGSDHRALFAQL